jgi:hypothetical protein
MHVVHFKKDHAQQVVTALAAGLPIPAPPEGWSEGAVLAVAGAALAELRRKPPHV